MNVMAQEQKITLEKIFKEKVYSTKGLRGMRSLNDGERYLTLEDNKINIYSYKTGERLGVFVDGADLINENGKNIPLSNYQLSTDEKKILIATDSVAIYRHSSKAEFYVWDIETKKLTQLSKEGKQRIPQFSPDGTKVAFVRDNNLFITDLIAETERQITKDGKFNEIIYGTTDWAYEEEFGFTTAFFWSPDGQYIAYYRFDERHVKEFQMTMYGDLYPEECKYKYPKSGEDNSLVDIYIYNLKDDVSKKADVGDNYDQYIPRIQWMPVGNQLVIYRLNRLQNFLQLYVVSAVDFSSKLLYEEENKYYIAINNNLTFAPDGKSFFLTSEKDGYNHIYRYYGGGTTQLTSGEYDVVSILGFDDKKGIVYYQAAESAPYNREVFGVNLKGKKMEIAVKQGTNNVRFSKGFKYYIHTWSDANTPNVYTVFGANGKSLRVLEDHQKMKERMKEEQFGDKEFFSFETEGGYSLNGWMIKPLGYDPSKKYPTLVYVYGGPGSQTVLNSWQGGALWYRMLAQKGILIVSVDNRGTGYRGEEFKKMTYLQLGKYETEDQIEVAKYLIKQGFTDPNHLGVYGWSYGGYMSSLCMTKGAEYFSTGIAVAPVTTWRYYDNIYTERYMRTPQENPEGYDQNSPINHVDKMKGNYLIIHGTADDNVHAQNTVDMTTALINADIDFEMFLYPNSNHGINTGENTSYHLYKKMTKFLTKHLLEK
jgi:dipeptidyl-peptidase-4